jgi:hypothetical protein
LARQVSITQNIKPILSIWYRMGYPSFGESQ